MNGFVASLVFVSAVDGCKTSGQVQALAELLQGKGTPTPTEWTSLPVWTDRRREGSVSSTVSY